MKQIWSGSTFKRPDAGELLDIVDQIHEYAVTTHRPFIASHLETWERHIETVPKETVYDTPELLPSLEYEQRAEKNWYSIKLNGRRVRKLLHDKRQNGTVLIDDELKVAQLESRIKQFKARSKVIPTEKFGSKQKRLDLVKSVTNAARSRTLARKRGRPRKIQALTNSVPGQKLARKRGRPRKIQAVANATTHPVLARKRGRPKKIQAIESSISLGMPAMPTRKRERSTKV